MLIISLFLSLLSLQKSHQIELTEWQTAALESQCSDYGTGNVPLKNDCTAYGVCQNGRLKSVEQCSDLESSFVPMFSVTHRKCVPTAFAHCQTMYALCPTLNGSRILQRVEDIDSSTKPEMEDFVHIPGDKLTDTEEEILSIFFSIDDANNAVPFSALLPVEGFKCPKASGLFPLSIDMESRDFIVCLQNLPYKTHCEADETFDVKEKDCVSKSLTVQYSGCRGKPDGVFSLPDSCSKFQVCCGDFGYVSRCPIGFHFNDQTAHCVLSHYSQCSS